MDGITAREAIRVLKEKYDLTLADTEEKSLNLLRTWAKRGYIERPLTRIGINGVGGRQGLYCEDLLYKLAIIRYLQVNYGLSLEVIKEIINRSPRYDYELWDKVIDKLKSNRGVFNVGKNPQINH